MSFIISWINFAILIIAILLLTYFYVRSVFPASLEKLSGTNAYPRCGQDRALGSIFEVITLVNYVVFKFFPLTTPLPEHFPWPGWISIVIAALIGIPALTLLTIGIQAAGEEATRPIKGTPLFKGIYMRVRHPQADGEVFLWLALGFALNSPFLVAFSFIFLPLFLLYCFVEEQDLVWRYGEDYIHYYRKTAAFLPKQVKKP